MKFLLSFILFTAVLSIPLEYQPCITSVHNLPVNPKQSAGGWKKGTSIDGISDVITKVIYKDNAKKIDDALKRELDWTSFTVTRAWRQNLQGTNTLAELKFDDMQPVCIEFYQLDLKFTLREIQNAKQTEDDQHRPEPKKNFHSLIDQVRNHKKSNKKRELHLPKRILRLLHNLRNKEKWDVVYNCYPSGTQNLLGGWAKKNDHLEDKTVLEYLNKFITAHLDDIQNQSKLTIKIATTYTFYNFWSQTLQYPNYRIEFQANDRNHGCLQINAVGKDDELIEAKRAKILSITPKSVVHGGKH